MPTDPLSIPCPYGPCSVGAGEPCVSGADRTPRETPHAARLEAAAALDAAAAAPTPPVEPAAAPELASAPADAPIEATAPDAIFEPVPIPVRAGLAPESPVVLDAVSTSLGVEAPRIAPPPPAAALPPQFAQRAIEPGPPPPLPSERTSIYVALPDASAQARVVIAVPQGAAYGPDGAIRAFGQEIVASSPPVVSQAPRVPGPGGILAPAGVDASGSVSVSPAVSPGGTVRGADGAFIAAPPPGAYAPSMRDQLGPIVNGAQQWRMALQKLALTLPAGDVRREEAIERAQRANDEIIAAANALIREAGGDPA